jgi:hypothetical protein
MALIGGGSRGMSAKTRRRVNRGEIKRIGRGHHMLEHLEQQKKLTINQWKIFAAATIGDMLDFSDFLLIAFVLAVIVMLLFGRGGRMRATVEPSSTKARRVVEWVGAGPGDGPEPA